MILLRVLSYNGAPVDGLSAQFDEIGGTIGRADSNQLVLPDPERTISRVHARIVFRAGGYSVVDNGSNPISVNGEVVGGSVELPMVGLDEPVSQGVGSAGPPSGGEGEGPDAGGASAGA